MTDENELRYDVDSGADPAKVRVLIGDPDVFSQRAVTRVLEQDGRFEVCATARDAAETIAAVVDTFPDICLLEVAMPGGGLAAAWEVKARLPGAHVVMFTIREGEEELLEALEIGVSGYLLKSALLNWLPNALMDVYRGTFAMPRRLTGSVVPSAPHDGAPPPRRSSVAARGSRAASGRC